MENSKKNIHFKPFSTTFLIIVMVLGSIIGVFAAQDTIGVYKKGECVDLIQLCGTCTYNNITSIIYPNSTKKILDQIMSERGPEYNYTFCNTDSIGIYLINGVGDLDGTATAWAYEMEITYSGEVLSEAQSTISITLLIMLILFLIAIMYSINYLPSENNTNENNEILSINYLKYLRPVLYMFAYSILMSVFFVSSNLAFAFLNESLVANVFFTLFKISLLLAPLVVVLWLVSIIVMIYNDREFKKLISRGFFPQQI